MGSALRGTGNFRPGMVVQTATVILNIVLAPMLIFGWGTGVALGVAGAALSTLIAIAIGVVWMVFYFLPAEAYLRFSFRDWAPRLDLWRDMLKIGLPAGAEFAFMAVYLMLVYAVSRPFGAAAQAGFGIGMRIIQACFLPVVALGFAVGPVAGQNFGARKARSRAADVSNRSRRSRQAPCSCSRSIVWLAAGPMVGVFSSDPQRHRGRRGVSPHHRVQLRRVRDRVRQLEHVPGDGQYDPVARSRRRRASSSSPCRCCCWRRLRIHPALDLVYLAGSRRRAAGDESVAAPARVPRAIELRRHWSKRPRRHLQSPPRSSRRRDSHHVRALA